MKKQKGFNPLASPNSRKRSSQNAPNPPKKKVSNRRQNALNNPRIGKKPKPTFKPAVSPPPTSPALQYGPVPTKITMSMDMRIDRMLQAVEANKPLRHYVMNRLMLGYPKDAARIMAMTRSDKLTLKYAASQNDKSEGIVNFSEDDSPPASDGDLSVPTKLSKICDIAYLRSMCPLKQLDKDQELEVTHIKGKLTNTKFAIPAKFLSYAKEAKELIDQGEYFERNTLCLETMGTRWTTFKKCLRVTLFFCINPKSFAIACDSMTNPPDLYNTKSGKKLVETRLKSALKRKRGGKKRQETDLEKLFHCVFPCFKRQSGLYPSERK